MLLQAKPEELDIRDAVIVNAANSSASMSLTELCHLGHYRQDLLPRGAVPHFIASGSFMPEAPSFTANGVQGSLIEIDRETGDVRLLRHWVVEDCGRIVNVDLVEGSFAAASCRVWARRALNIAATTTRVSSCRDR